MTKGLCQSPSTFVTVTLVGSLLAALSSACSNRPIDGHSSDSGAQTNIDAVVTPLAPDAAATDDATVTTVTYVEHIQPICGPPAGAATRWARLGRAGPSRSSTRTR